MGETCSSHGVNNNDNSL